MKRDWNGIIFDEVTTEFILRYLFIVVYKRGLRCSGLYHDAKNVCENNFVCLFVTSSRHGVFG